MPRHPLITITALDIWIYMTRKGEISMYQYVNHININYKNERGPKTIPWGTSTSLMIS